MQLLARRQHPDFFADRRRLLPGNTDQDFAGRWLTGLRADRVRIALLGTYAVDIGLGADMLDRAHRKLEGNRAFRRSVTCALEILRANADHAIWAARQTQV